MGVGRRVPVVVPLPLLLINLGFCKICKFIKEVYILCVHRARGGGGDGGKTFREVSVGYYQCRMLLIQILIPFETADSRLYPITTFLSPVLFASAHTSRHFLYFMIYLHASQSYHTKCTCHAHFTT